MQQTEIPQGLMAMLANPQMQQMLMQQAPQQLQPGQQGQIPETGMQGLNMPQLQAQKLNMTDDYSDMGGGSGGGKGGLGTGSSGQNDNFAKLAGMTGGMTSL